MELSANEVKIKMKISLKRSGKEEEEKRSGVEIR